MSQDPRFAPDLYDRFGLPSSADARDIRQRFRHLARLYHPDINPDKAAHERFVALQAGYDVLSDPEIRKAYDAWLDRESLRLRPMSLHQRLGPTVLQRDIHQQRLYVLMDLLAASGAEATRAPLNLALVLDRSSSMRGDRLRQVKSAARMLAEQLGARDVFSIVTFSDRAQVVMPSGRGTPLHVIRSALDSIEPSGGTEIAQGLMAGLIQVQIAHAPGMLSHIILLTDGQTYGDEARCMELAREAANDQIGITALGIGNDWNDRFLDSLASLARGRAHFIAQPAQALNIFERQLRQIQKTVASEGVLSLTLESGVEVLTAYEVAPDLRVLKADAPGRYKLGDLPGDPPLRVLFELSVKAPDREVLLGGEVTLTARQRHNNQVSRTTQPMVVSFADELGPYQPEVVEAARYAATLRLQERAWNSVAQGDVSGAKRDLTYLATRFLEMGQNDLAQATRAELDGLQRTGQLSAGGAKVIKYGTRMLALPSSDANGRDS